MGGFELELTWELLGLISSLAASEAYTSAQNAHNAYLHFDDTILSTEDLSIDIKKFTPALTGGNVTGATVKDIEEAAVDTFTATDIGAITFASGKLVGYSLLNALGVNITSNFQQIDDILADVYTDIFGKIILANQLSSVSVPLLFKDGATYISSKFATLFSNKVYDKGIFSKGGYESYINFPTTAGQSVNITFGNMTEAELENLISVAVSNASTLGYSETSLITSTVITGIVRDFYENMGYLPWKTFSVSISRPWTTYAISVSISVYSGDDQELSTTIGASSSDTHGNYLTAIRNIPIIYKEYGIRSGNRFTLTYTGTSSSVEAGSLLNNNYDQGSVLTIVSAFGATLKPAIEGIDEQIGATTPKDNDIDIGLTYPNWYGRGIDVGYLDDISKTLGRTRFIPIAIDGEDDVKTRDRTQTVTQEGTVVETKDKTVTVEYADTIPTVAVTQEGTKVDVADIPDVIPQPTPPVVIPTGTTSAGLATIYNPTEAQVNALKGELWSQNIITTLQSIFLNNPMDAIISLSKVFCTPHTDGTATIKLGYVQTGVTGVKTVDDQYTTIDCGTVNVPEIYGNTTDYEPYTNVSVFLPFIGIQNLSAKDVVSGKLQIIYRVDVTTGACIAQLFVTKQGVKQMLYSFEGNCAVEIPLSGSNANRAIIGLASIAASTVAPGAGLALAGGAMNLVNGVNLQRSGGFQSNAGAMNNKKPYLIINRVLPYEASGYNQIYGYPSNNRVLLNSVTGYTRVKDVHVEGISCTDYEKNMIEEQLKAGVLL